MVKHILLLPKLVIWKTSFQGVVLLIISLSCLLFSSTGNTNEVDKSTLKALYTYKFGKFTQWPTNKLNITTESFEYCILGASPFSQTTMDLIIGKTIQSIPITIKVFSSGLIPENVLSACHILFISKSEKRRLATLFNRLKKLPVLTVSDIRDFSLKGGMITLTEELGQLRFQINPRVVQQADISISSKMMELAETIDDGQGL